MICSSPLGKEYCNFYLASIIAFVVCKQLGSIGIEFGK